MARRPLMAGNWKMYKTISEGVDMVKALKENCKGVDDRDILLCVPATMISAIAKEIDGSNVWVGAENMHFEEKGAFTGEISPIMVKDAGAESVILGHSERRHVFGETDELINKKVKSAIAHDIWAILCVGELLEEREAGKVEEVVKTQIVGGYAGLSKEDALKVTVAYEPVWAIGTGKTATPEDADDAHAVIRKVLTDLYDAEVADKCRILYGGSVKPGNVDNLMAKENIDGALVGGASLDAESFTRIVKFQ
jgi:triosephosphate isomerase (TIM)